jgi:hypothetical protein
MSNFWTAAAGVQDPKRGFRFRVQITKLGNSADYIWYAKKADKPKVSFTEAKHEYLNHTYYWPGRASWNEVSITFVDPVEPDLAGSMSKLLETAGYRIPEGITDNIDFASMSKAGSTDALGDVFIEQINEKGEVLEKWTLKQAWVMEVTFGDLDYSSDDLLELTMKFRYDWASFKSEGTQQSANKGKPFFAGPTSG